MITTKLQNTLLRGIKSDLEVFVTSMADDIRIHQAKAIECLKEQGYEGAEIVAEVADITDKYFEETLINRLCSTKNLVVDGENHRRVYLNSLRFSMVQFVISMIDIDDLVAQVMRSIYNQTQNVKQQKKRGGKK